MYTSPSLRHDSRRVPELNCDTYPVDLVGYEQWIAWKQAADGRKIPRAPYAHPDWPDRYVDAQDESVWTDFETAQTWCRKLSGYDLAFTIRDRDQHPDEDLVLIDYDFVCDIDDGRIHPAVRNHIERAGSYADISPSRTGVHILGRGQLPEGIRTITDSLPDVDRFPKAEIEVYDSARYVTMTGVHIDGTPPETRHCQDFIDELVEECTTISESRPDHMLDGSATSREGLANIESTSDIQDIYDAIRQTRPSDIRLWSPITEERSDGTKSRDPVWANSKTGTRLAEVDDVWIYRDGLIALDALQVVALEERIITDERVYPDGRDFWRAVNALRNRGASIPKYESSDNS